MKFIKWESVKKGHKFPKHVDEASFEKGLLLGFPGVFSYCLDVDLL